MQEINSTNNGQQKAPQLKDITVTKYFKNQQPPKFSDKDTSKWRDPLFPPEEASLITEEYKNGKLKAEQSQFVKEEIVKHQTEIEWKRVSDVLDNNFHVFEDKIEISDIKQGGLSVCYFLSALAALTEFPDYIHQRILTKDPNPFGYYEVLLFVDGEWQIVIVDDFFPYQKGTKYLRFTQMNGTELWVVLLEKAWAKVNGGYANIVLGQVSDAFQALTGFAIQVMDFDNKKSLKEIWDNLKISDSTDYIMCTSTKNENFLDEMGLIKGHAYTLIKAKEVLYSDKTYQLIQLFNPWGRKEWTGDWSDNSHLWNDELKKLFEKPEPDPGRTSDDGQFFMDVADYPKYFETLYICHMMYGATLRSYRIPSEIATKPLVFTFTLEEDCKVCLSVFFKHWRFNRHLLDIVRPFSLVFGQIKSDKEVLLLDGDYSVRDDIQIVRRLLKGKYVVWLYSLAEQVKEENFSFNFRFAADQKSTVNFVGEDKELKIIKHLILSNRRRILKETSSAANNDPKYNEDPELKKAGLRAYYGINDTSMTHEVQFICGQMKDVRFLEDKYKGAKKTENFVLTPGHDILLLSAKLGLENDDSFKITPRKILPPKKCEKVIAPNLDYLNILNSTEDAASFEIQEYSFADASELKFVRKFDQMGQKKKEFYTMEDLYAEHRFAAEEVFYLLQDNGKSDAVLTINQESSGLYMGEQPPKERGKIYYGVRINNVLGEIYIGSFRDNTFHLKGKLYKKNKLYYEGDYREGQKEGKGILFSDNRDVYRGTFKNDRLKGLIRIYHENTNSMSIVFMDYDKKHGYAMEVNYPQRNTKIAYYQSDTLVNFVVVEYEFFKKSFDMNKFTNDDSFPNKFEDILRARFPMKETTDLLLRRIWTEREEDRQCRARDPFMYDMLRELSYSFITQIKVRDIKYEEYGTSYSKLFDMENRERDYMMVTLEKTDKVLYLSKFECYIFFLGVGNEKPLYDKNVRWLLFSKDHTLLFEGGYDHNHNGKYYKANGEFLHALVTGKAYYFFPNRGISYGDYSLEGSPNFSIYNFSGFWNNFVQIRQIIKAEVPVITTTEDISATDKRYDYFIPKKEVQEIHMERIFNKGGIPEHIWRNKEVTDKLVQYINKHYPWFYVLPTGKACEDSEDLSFFRFELEDNRISLVQYGLPIYSVVENKQDQLVNETIEYKSSVFERCFGRVTKTEDNYTYIGAVRDNKRHGRGVENFDSQVVIHSQKKVVNKFIHMTFNENERDGYNLEFDAKRNCEAYYYNDGIKCSENLNLSIYDRENLIGLGETFEQRTERRIKENERNWEELVNAYGNQYQVLLNVLQHLPESVTPYLTWSWKYTIDGVYIGEVDPYHQSCGRGILLYNNHSMNQGAYVGYWTAGVRHGQGIHVNLQRSTYYSCIYSMNEQEIPSRVAVNEAHVQDLVGFSEDVPREFSGEIESLEDLVEHDTEDREPKILIEDLEIFQWFANKNDDLANPSVEEMSRSYAIIDELRKLFVIE